LLVRATRDEVLESQERRLSRWGESTTRERRKQRKRKNELASSQLCGPDEHGIRVRRFPASELRFERCTSSRRLLAHSPTFNKLESFFDCARRSMSFFFRELRVAARREFRRVECASLHSENPYILAVRLIGLGLRNQRGIEHRHRAESPRSHADRGEFQWEACRRRNPRRA
jgi:hypothetical protein